MRRDRAPARLTLFSPVAEGPVMDSETQVKLAVYRHFAETGRRPEPGAVASRAGVSVDRVLAAYQGLRAQRLLALTLGILLNTLSGRPARALAAYDGR